MAKIFLQEKRQCVSCTVPVDTVLEPVTKSLNRDSDLLCEHFPSATGRGYKPLPRPKICMEIGFVSRLQLVYLFSVSKSFPAQTVEYQDLRAGYPGREG